MMAATPPERSSSVATARPFSKLSLLPNLEEEFATSTFMNESYNANLPPTPPHDHEVISVAKPAPRRHSQTPTEGWNQAPGILDRRGSTRPSGSSRSGSGDSVRSRGSFKGPGRRIPVKVNGVVSSPLASPNMSLSSMRNDMRLTDDDITPGESSVSLFVFSMMH